MKANFGNMVLLLCLITGPGAFPSEFTKIPDVAEYKGADWTNFIVKKHFKTVNDAEAFASKHPEVSFFFYANYDINLESKGQFKQGDAAFFSGEPWWGSAPKLADGYVKEKDPGVP